MSSPFPTVDRLLALVGAYQDKEPTMLADLVADRFVVGRPQRISREAPVLILEQTEEELVPGGGGNAVANVRALGGRPLLVGAVGDDALAERLLDALMDRDIATDAVLRRTSLCTPAKTRILARTPTKMRQQIVRLDVGDRRALNEAEREALLDGFSIALSGRGSRSDVLVVSDYGYGAAEPDLVHALRGLLGGSVRVLVDSRHRLDAFGTAFGATPNQEEAEALVGHALDREEELLGAGRALVDQLGVQFLLVTRGSRGMALFSTAGCVLIPVHGTDQVADVTGAGDTVIGTLAISLAAGATPVEAAVLANYAGGIVVMKAGTATLTADELADEIRMDTSLLENLRWVPY